MAQGRLLGYDVFIIKTRDLRKIGKDSLYGRDAYSRIHDIIRKYNLRPGDRIIVINRAQDRARQLIIGDGTFKSGTTMLSGFFETTGESYLRMIDDAGGINTARGAALARDLNRLGLLTQDLKNQLGI